MEKRIGILFSMHVRRNPFALKRKRAVNPSGLKPIKLDVTGIIQVAGADKNRNPANPVLPHSHARAGGIINRIVAHRTVAVGSPQVQQFQVVLANLFVPCQVGCVSRSHVA